MSAVHHFRSFAILALDAKGGRAAFAPIVDRRKWCQTAKVIDLSDIIAAIPWPGERRLTGFFERHPRVLAGTLMVLAVLVGAAFYFTRHGS
jgi:hypothetical protein